MRLTTALACSLFAGRSKRGQAQLGMGNPAAINCVDQNYTEQSMYAPNGDQYSICIFSNVTSCEEWAFYRGECNTTNPNFGVYCADNGGEVSQENVDWGETIGAPPATYEVCTSNGEQCTDYDYYADNNCSFVPTSDFAVPDVTSKKDYNVPFGSAAQVTCTSGLCCVVGGEDVWGSSDAEISFSVGDDCKWTSTGGTFSDCGNTEGCDLNCSNDCIVQITPTTSDPTQADDAPATIGMPNPASTGCADKGGTEETLYQADGGQYGVCVFNDGTACESWALGRGECAEGTTPVFSTYCADSGGEIVEENVDWGDVQGAPPATYEVCTVNGAQCAANYYYTTGCADLTVPGTTPGTDSITPAPPVPVPAPAPPAGPTPAKAPEEVLGAPGSPGEPSSGSNGLSYGVMASVVVISIQIMGVLV